MNTTPKHSTCAETKYGFDWESARVERIAAVQRKASDAHQMVVIGIGNTADEYAKRVEVYVSPNGKSIRVFRGGKELR